MTRHGKITGYRYDGKNTIVQVVVPSRIYEMDRYLAEGDAPAEIRIDDGRMISVDQRKKAYATINDIAAHTGHAQEFLKEFFKYQMVSEHGVEYFSLGDCDMTTAREYINTLIDFCVRHGVHLQQSALERTDDISRFLICCLIYRKCCLCGREGEVHHIDAIGMGNDRTTLDDGENEVICLCRTHHTEAHQIGVDSFAQKHKVFGIKRKYISQEG